MCLSFFLSLSRRRRPDHMNGTCISRREKQMMICGFQIEESRAIDSDVFCLDCWEKRRASGDPLQSVMERTLAKAALNGAGGASLVI